MQLSFNSWSGLILLCAALQLPAMAQSQPDDTTESPLTLNAYGTLGLAATDQAQAGYRPTVSYRNILHDQWSGRLDNRLGAQARYALTPSLAVVAHVLARRNGGDEVSAEWLWGMLQWTPAPGWALQAGRFQNTLFLTSDNQAVGYAQPWVRPPVELYNLGGETANVDGVMLRYNRPLSDWQVGLTAHAGRAKLVRPFYRYENHPNAALALSLSDNNWLFRVSTLVAKTDYQAPAAQAVADLITAQNPQAGADYQTGALGWQHYSNAGFRYEQHPWLIQGEFARTNLRKKVLPDQRAWYLTAAYSVGDWTPYISFASLRGVSNLDENRLSGNAQKAAQALLLGKRNDQQTLSLGVRWDLRPGMALKAQWDQVRVNAGEPGLLQTPLPAGQERVRVLSVVLDWSY